MKHSFFSRSFILTILVALLAMTISFDAMAKPDKKLIKEAATAYEKGDFDKALEKFNQAYAEDSTQTSLLYNIGRVYESKADYANAVEYYTQFLAAPGSDEDARDDAYERIKKCNDILEAIGGKKAKKGGKGANAAAPALADAPKGKKGGKAAAAPAGGCIDINTASADELTALPGVGDSKAQTIIANRNSEGPFKSVDDLSRIKGFGAKTVDKFRPLVCPIAGGAAPAAPAVAAPAPKAKAEKAPAAPKVKAPAGSAVIDI